jgi:hypothetical protein
MTRLEILGTGDYDSDNYWIKVRIAENKEIEILVPKDDSNELFAEGEENKVGLNLMTEGHYY